MQGESRENRTRTGVLSKKTLYFSIVNFRLDTIDVMCRVNFIDIFRYRDMSDTHSSIGVTDPIIFWSANSPVLYLYREEVILLPEGALSKGISSSSSYSVC